MATLRCERNNPRHRNLKSFLKKKLDFLFGCANINIRRRGVAQLGSALLWGSRGRGFKSRRSDCKKKRQKPHWHLHLRGQAISEVNCFLP